MRALGRCHSEIKVGSFLSFLRVIARGLAWVWLVFVFGAGTASFSQPSAIDGPWSGWAQCRINVQGPDSYNHTETHTWTLTGGPPTVQGAMRIHPATWTVGGQGSFVRTQGTQTLTAQWTTNAPPMNAPLALFVRASDGMLIVKSSHSQLRAPGGVVGMQTVSINGVAQGQSAIALEAFEFSFPGAEVSGTNTSITSANTFATNGSVGPMQPGGSRGTAACTWQFAPASGTVASNPPSGAAYKIREMERPAKTQETTRARVLSDRIPARPPCSSQE
jgi:hypothetical protein